MPNPSCEVELDELHTFVYHKRNSVWVWIALCRHTRRVLAFHVGDRRDSDAQTLYEQLPDRVQQTAYFFSDRYAVYARVLPNDRHLLPRQAYQSRGAVQ